MTHNEEVVGSVAPEYEIAYDSKTLRSAELAYLLLQFRNSRDIMDEVAEATYQARRFLEKD